VVGPDDFGIHCPNVFKRPILRGYGINGDAIAGGPELAIAKNNRRGKAAVEAAISSADPVLVCDLVIKLNVKLIVWAMRQSIQSKIIEFPGEVWLGVQADDGLSDRVNFFRRDYVQNSIGLNLRSCRA
jgi:hypothetical protein